MPVLTPKPPQATTTSSESTSLGRVILKRGKARPIMAGHPWIYSGAIAEVEGEPISGDVVSVLDERGRDLGVGSFNATARIAVRMLGALPDGGIAELIATRFADALSTRRLLGLPHDGTDAYRLVNGAGDRLPGVVCDVLGDLASVQLTTAAAERWLPHILAALPHERVYCQVPKDSARMEGIAHGDRAGRGDLEAPVVVQEHGIRWAIRMGQGQKTGFYTDQRDNRRMVSRLAAGGTLLDCHTYLGGFALGAARAGATSVVGVDSSAPALEIAQQAALDNDLTAQFIKSDARRFLENCEDLFDVVVLDPPKLARRRADLDRAYAAYRALNASAIARVRPGGWLFSCSCSGAVDEEMFLRMLTDAGFEAGRTLQVHTIRGPGADHPTPAAAPEARYLTAVLARVS